jgi:hypothetical protein
MPNAGRSGGEAVREDLIEPGERRIYSEHELP